MSAFRHIDNLRVRPIDEELQDMGLSPERFHYEVDRQTAMLEGGPSPLDPAGLREGSESPRSLAQYGATLLAEKCGKPHNSKDEEDDEEEEDEEGDDSEGMGEAKPAENDPEVMEAKWIQQAIKDPGRVREYLGVPEGEKIPMAKLDAAIEKLKATEEKDAEQKSLLSALVLAKRLKSGIGESIELDEALGVVKKMRGAAARLAKRLRHREYLKKRGTEKRQSKLYRKKFKRKIKRIEMKKLRKFGRKGLEKLHKMGRRIVQKSWSDQLANIQEELDRDLALAQQPVEEETGELSIVAEAALNAADTAWYLGEIFEAMGDEAGQVLYQLSQRSTDLAEAIDEAGEPTEEQEAQLETILTAVVRALAEHDDRGSPSLGEAIGVGMVNEGLGDWADLVEHKLSLDEGWSPSSPGIGAHSVVPGLDPDQERVFDAVVLIATNDGAAYKKRDAKGAVKKAIADHKREAASNLAYDAKKVAPYAEKEVARRWAEA